MCTKKRFQNILSQRGKLNLYKKIPIQENKFCKILSFKFKIILTLIFSAKYKFESSFDFDALSYTYIP